jgi:hypothetical protein
VSNLETANNESEFDDRENFDNNQEFHFNQFSDVNFRSTERAIAKGW